MAEESILTCPACGFRFNYRWTVAMSMNAMRLSGARSFRCPHCHERQRFDLQRSGHDPARPTYDDTVRASTIALVLGPLFLAVPIALLLALELGGRLLTVAPIALALAWLAGVAGRGIYRGEVPLATAGDR